MVKKIIQGIHIWNPRNHLLLTAFLCAAIFFIAVQTVQYYSLNNNPLLSDIHPPFNVSLPKHEDSDFISGPHYPPPTPTGSHNYKKAEWDEDSNYRVDFSSTYKEMESKFKVYVYRDDVLYKYYKFPFPTTDPDRLTWEYRNEGYFFRNINMSTFLTTDPKQAQLFFIPIRTHLMQSTVSIMI